MKVSVVSLGCNKNLVDTEVMLAHLARAGCVLVDEPEEADCLLINTCSFLTEAVTESLDSIVELAGLKVEGGPGRLVVTGCLVSRYGEEILKEIPEVDAIVPPTDLSIVVKAVMGEEQGAGRRAQGAEEQGGGRWAQGAEEQGGGRWAQGAEEQGAGRWAQGTEREKSDVRRPASNEKDSPEFKINTPSLTPVKQLWETGSPESLKTQMSNVERRTSNLKPQTANLTDSGLSTLDSQLPFPPRILSWPPHRAYLKIGEGCSNCCSYCLIPSIRGEFVSRARDSLLAEMEHLVRMGVKEVTLVAQDSGRYGTDGKDGSLPTLIQSLLSIAGDYWLRVLYVHPKRVTGDLLSVMGSDPRVCRYLDIPFQHASPRVLERMGRGDAPHPREVVDKVRAGLPGVFLRTTLMTGFPGETSEDFDLLLGFLLDTRFDHLGVFAYSREEGTAAAGMDGQVDTVLAKERADILMREQALISSEMLAAFVGREMTVLTEDNDEDGPFGRHQGQAPEVDGVVRLDREVEGGAFVTVRIIGSDVYDLEGEVLDTDLEIPPV